VGESAYNGADDMSNKVKKGISDLFFITGVIIITLLTGITIGGLGRINPSYCVDDSIVCAMFIMTTIPFSLGYWSGRFYQEEE
jgi:hypothetical protein